MEALALIAVFIILIVVCTMIKVVPESEEYIIERFGKYHKTFRAGINFKVPGMDVIRKKVSLKENVLDFLPQPVITKDNVTMKIDSVVYMTVFDSKLYTYKIANPRQAVEMLCATTLRNLIGSMTLDEALTSRDRTKATLQQELDEATDAWGIKISRVEIKNLMVDDELQEVMSKQMRAEREKRQAITEAEAHKQSVVTTAEGDKQAKVLAAQAEAEAAVARAEGEAKATKLRADAESYALKKLTESGVSPEILKLKGYEAMKDIAEGNATKIFMPTELIDEVSRSEIFGEGLKSAQAEAYKARVAKSDVSDPHMNIALSQRENSPIHQAVAELSQKYSAEQSADDAEENGDD